MRCRTHFVRSVREACSRSLQRFMRSYAAEGRWLGGRAPYGYRYKEPTVGEKADYKGRVRKKIVRGIEVKSLLPGPESRHCSNRHTFWPGDPDRCPRRHPCSQAAPPETETSTGYWPVVAATGPTRLILQ